MAGRLRTWWGDTPKPVRWMAYTAVPAGVAALVLGVVGDAHGWWKDREFLTNLVSSFTGLLLGVPFALVVLSHLGSMQADAAIRRAAVRRGREAAAQFRQATLRGFQRPSPALAVTDLNRIRAANARLRDRISEFRTGFSLIPLGSLSTVDAAPLVRAYDERASIIDEVFALSAGRREAWLAEIVQSWQRLDQDVRPRLEEVGAQWMLPPQYTVLRQAGKRLDNLSAHPMTKLRRTRQLLDQQESGLPSPSYDDRMRAVNKIQDDTTATLEVIGALLGILRTLSVVDEIAS